MEQHLCSACKNTTIDDMDVLKMCNECISNDLAYHGAYPILESTDC